MAIWPLYLRDIFRRLLQRGSMVTAALRVPTGESALRPGALPSIAENILCGHFPGTFWLICKVRSPCRFVHLSFLPSFLHFACPMLDCDVPKSSVMFPKSRCFTSPVPPATPSAVGPRLQWQELPSGNSRLPVSLYLVTETCWDGKAQRSFCYLSSAFTHLSGFSHARK